MLVFFPPPVKRHTQALPGLPNELLLFWHQYPWPFGSFLCSLRSFLSERWACVPQHCLKLPNSSASYASVLTIVSFSMERYLAICRPLHPLPSSDETRCQRPARFSFLENSREFFLIFTSRSRSRAVSISLSLLEKEWRDFIFHFSLLEKSESYLYFTLFSREKRMKSGAGYNLAFIFVPNCISKDRQISSMHVRQFLPF